MWVMCSHKIIIFNSGMYAGMRVGWVSGVYIGVKCQWLFNFVSLFKCSARFFLNASFLPRSVDYFVCALVLYVFFWMFLARRFGKISRIPSLLSVPLCRSCQ